MGRMRTPLEPTLDDRRHVERVLRDLASIVSLVEADKDLGRRARQLLLLWLADIWLVLREAGYSRESLAEQALGELTWADQQIIRERDPALSEAGG